MYAYTGVHTLTSGYPYAVLAILIFFSFSLLTIYPKPLYACQSRSRAGGVMPPVLPKICFYRAFLMTKQGALTMLAVAFASRCYRSIIAETPYFSARTSAFWLPWYQRTARPHFDSARPRRLTVFFYHSGTSVKSSSFYYAVLLSRVRLCCLFCYIQHFV